MKRSFFIFLCFGIAAFSCLFCTTGVDVAGGTSSTDNGKIVGMICRKDNVPAPNTRVSLRSAHFDPNRDTAVPSIDTTDSEGNYEFNKLAPGIYTLEAVAIDSRTRALVTSVMVDDSGTTHTSTASLAKPGALEIQVPHCSTASCYIYVPGTSLYGEIRNGIGYIDSVPAGYIPAVYYADRKVPAAIHSVTTGISVIEGATRFIADYSQWNHSRKIVLNTTQSGAGISGNVYNFPVLIRLSESNFDFSQAQSDGRDLRFKKPDDTPLPYEIERWDTEKKRAEIWVKIDTIFGNDNTRFFRMYWGNTSAVSESNSAAVFDTATGFQGVWHLSEENDNNVPDATGNHYDGTSYNMNEASAVTGTVGMARDFDGSSGYISMPSTSDSKLNFPQNGTYSISLWACTDTIDTLWRAVAGKGHEQYYVQLKCLGENRATWEFVEFHDNLGWEYSEDSVPPAPGSGEWLHIVGVRDGQNQRLYINGEEVVDTASVMEGEYPRDSGDDFTIGRHGHTVTIPYEQGWSYFDGKIDEVRVTSLALSPDWIRLCYMNQQTDDTLTVFE